MASVSLRAYLAALDAHELAVVLNRRPDVLVEPAPTSLDELAHRLTGIDSLARALPLMDADEVAVTRIIAVAGPVPVDVTAERMRSDPATVRDTVARLRGRALAFEVDGCVAVPELLTQHFAAELQHLRPLAAVIKQALVADLTVAVDGLGGDSHGLTKARLAEQLITLLGDPEVVTRAIAALPPGARRHLDLLRSGELYLPLTPRGPVAHLTQAGLLIGGPYHRPELPREVAAMLALDGNPPITGMPALPPSTDIPTEGNAAAEAAVRALVGLLDEATTQPLARLKKGGVGARERARLAKRLGINEPALWIDLAAALDMLDPIESGYAAAEQYSTWRDEPVAARWAAIVLGWFALDLAPTSRETDDGGEVAPPEDMLSGAGLLRRAWLRAAAGGRSVAAAAAHIDWFAPLHGYDDVGRARKIAAARHEAELLGVIAGDRLTMLGELLVAEREPAPLAARAAPLLPDTRPARGAIRPDRLGVRPAHRSHGKLAGGVRGAGKPGRRDGVAVHARQCQIGTRHGLDRRQTALRAGRGVRPTAAATRGLPVRRRRPTPRQRQGPPDAHLPHRSPGGDRGDRPHQRPGQATAVADRADGADQPNRGRCRADRLTSGRLLPDA